MRRSLQTGSSGGIKWCSFVFLGCCQTPWNDSVERNVRFPPFIIMVTLKPNYSHLNASLWAVLSLIAAPKCAARWRSSLLELAVQLGHCAGVWEEHGAAVQVTPSRLVPNTCRCHDDCKAWWHLVPHSCCKICPHHDVSHFCLCTVQKAGSKAQSLNVRVLCLFPRELWLVIHLVNKGLAQLCLFNSGNRAGVQECWLLQSHLLLWATPVSFCMVLDAASPRWATQCTPAIYLV